MTDQIWKIKQRAVSMLNILFAKVSRKGKILLALIL